MKSKAHQALLKQDLSYTVTGKIWIQCGKEKFFGPGPVDLLQQIEKTGSISKAAREMGMSYKKAWELINQINAKATKPFVITKSGGEQGGGSTITDEAKLLIAYYIELRENFLSFLQNETEELMLHFR
jgi:molybdate transport system regulatory protein